MSDSIARMHEQMENISEEVNKLVYSLTGIDYKPRYYTTEQLLIGNMVHIDVGNHSIITIDSTKQVVINERNIVVLLEGSFSIGYFLYYQVLTN